LGLGARGLDWGLGFKLEVFSRRRGGEEDLSQRKASRADPTCRNLERLQFNYLYVSSFYPPDLLFKSSVRR
jgi:hypothetical protein